MATRSWHTDWDKCCLCQTDRKEGLTSPLTNPSKRVDDGYSQLGRNIPRFLAVSELPLKLNPARLDDGNGIEETLRKNKAQYHSSCRLLFNNTKLQRAEKRAASAAAADSSESSNNVKLPRRITDSKTTECFLCEEEGDSLRQAMTMKLNKKINDCAKTLSDGKLLAKLSAGDVIAQELKYHPACLVALYNRERAFLNVQKQKNAEDTLQRQDAYPMAFSELVTYIIESENESSDPPIFRLGDLCSLYRERLDQLGIESPDVHAIRLKEQLLFHMPELEAHHQGRDVLLAFKKDVGEILAQASKYGEAMTLAKAAGYIRRDMLKHKKEFNSTFHDQCLEDTVPTSLLQFVCMIEHEIVVAIGPERVSGILFFHAFTGCDVVSGFRGKGKKSAWLTWNVCNDVSKTFMKLSHCPREVFDDDLYKLEQFTVLMYDRSSAASSVDEARLDLFARKQRSYDAIPPTRAALMEHAKRAAYQSGIIWGQATIPNPETSTPADWGWIRTGETWQICWTALPPIAVCCQELTKCSCKKGCTRRCKCFRSGLSCTALCSCVCEQ